jgi:hypothetical protein
MVVLRVISVTKTLVTAASRRVRMLVSLTASMSEFEDLGSAVFQT